MTKCRKCTNVLALYLSLLPSSADTPSWKSNESIFFVQVRCRAKYNHMLAVALKCAHVQQFQPRHSVSEFPPLTCSNIHSRKRGVGPKSTSSALRMSNSSKCTFDVSLGLMSPSRLCSYCATESVKNRRRPRNDSARAAGDTSESHGGVKTKVRWFRVCYGMCSW